MIPVTRVWESLYLGGRDDAEALYRSNPCCITTVISLCEDRVLRRNPDIRYVHLPVADAMPISLPTLEAIMSAISVAIRRGTVLLHCQHGVSRAPIITAAWMDWVGYKRIDSALAELRTLRPIVDPSSIFLSSVKHHLR